MQNLILHLHQFPDAPPESDKGSLNCYPELIWVKREQVAKLTSHHDSCIGRYIGNSRPYLPRRTARGNDMYAWTLRRL